MKLIKNICLIGVVTALLTGCRGDLMDLTPYSSISSGNMWTSENLADMGVTGIYNRLLADNVAYDLYKFECFGVSADCRDRADYRQHHDERRPVLRLLVGPLRRHQPLQRRHCQPAECAPERIETEPPDG